jgi:hypothetical protein
MWLDAILAQSIKIEFHLSLEEATFYNANVVWHHRAISKGHKLLEKDSAWSWRHHTKDVTSIVFFFFVLA